jgi:hypothetical protein
VFSVSLNFWQTDFKCFRIRKPLVPVLKNKKLYIKESPIVIISKTLKNHQFSWKNQEGGKKKKNWWFPNFFKFLRTTVIYQNQFFEDFEKWQIREYIPQLKTYEYLPLILRTTQHWWSPSSNFPGYIFPRLRGLTQEGEGRCWFTQGGEGRRRPAL